MRLGQLARKYDIPVQEIIDYLKEETGEKFHANAKLYDAIETQIFKHFDLYPDNPVLEQTEDVSLESQEEKSGIQNPESMSPEDDIASVEGELAIPDEKDNISKSEDIPVEERSEHNEDEVIQTDRLIEMLESADASLDIGKYKLIKAPKKELPGLKVLGKVDLPEPKKKPEPKAEKDENNYTKKGKRQQISEEEKERRRLKAKRKKEAYEARQEKRRKEQEARQLKELKAKHYEQKLKKADTPKQHKRDTSQPQETIPQPVAKKKEPKTLLGKWWRWMNT